MTNDVYGGKNSKFFIGYETSFQSGYDGTGHVLGINPSPGFATDRPINEQDKLTTFCSYVNTHIWDTEQAPVEIPIEGRFFDPFLMAMFFQYRAVESWGAAAKEISGNMHTDAGSAKQSMWMQVLYKNLGGGTDIQREFYGMLPVKYELIGEKGQLLKEIITFKVTRYDNPSDISHHVLTTTYYSTSYIDSNNCFSGWDDNNSGFETKNCTLSWTSGADTSFASMFIESFHLTLEANYETSQKFSSLYHEVKWRGLQSWQLELTGKLSNKTLLEEAEKTYANKDKDGTVKLQIDSDSGFEKYLQFTNAYVSSESCPLSMPEAGNVIEANVIMLGGAESQASFSFHYDGSTLTDSPADAISTS